jgi:hypothetical protein
MARVSKMARRKFSFARGIHFCPIISFALPASLYCKKYVYIYTNVGLHTDCIWITVASKQHWEWNIFTQIGIYAKC